MIASPSPTSGRFWGCDSNPSAYSKLPRMPKFVSDHAEVQRLASNIQAVVAAWPFVRLRLMTSQKVEGFVASIRSGNNGGGIDGWAYFGTVTIQPARGPAVEVDALDIVEVAQIRVGSGGGPISSE